MLYKYPQAEFPYHWLIEENRRRRGQGLEFELLDTGVFDQDRYFDIVIEYAKATTEDLVVRIEACNRGPEAARLHILVQLWFRNTWAWGPGPGSEPAIRRGSDSPDGPCLVADDTGVTPPATIPIVYRLGRRTLDGPAGAAVLFTDNESNGPRVFGPG